MVLAKKKKNTKNWHWPNFQQKVAYNQLIKMKQNNGIHLKAFNFQQKK